MQSATMSGSTRRRLIARQLDEFRAALQQQRMFRTEQLADLAAAAKDSVTSRTDHVHDEIADALRAGATAALDDIHSALRRIETGTFGACTACGGAIPIERLEILPMTALCMQCARIGSVERYAGATGPSVPNKTEA